jgi:hypothetical protein
VVTDPDQSIDTSLLTPFNQVAPFIKHPKFDEEKEWRIVTKDILVPKKLEYRVGGSMLIPYFDAKIDPSSPSLFPIRKIIVGPSLEQDLAMNSIAGIFSKNNFPFMLTRSEIPYRSR